MLVNDTTAIPRLRVLSLGAGVQSSALLILAVDKQLPAWDAAIFADTGWESADVYAHLDRLTDLAATADIPVLRVTAGNIRHDALDAAREFVSLPLFVAGASGAAAMGQRQCTGFYKIRPLKAEIRRLLGYPHPAPVPRGVVAEQAIGISRDEVHRARDADAAYLRNTFPLLEWGWTRRDCVSYLESRGFPHVPKSSCIGCPYRTNGQWRDMRDRRPAEWADAVDFDRRLRHGPSPALLRRVPMFVHRSRRPLDTAPIDRLTDQERHDKYQPPLLGLDELTGCSPWACRSDTPEVTGESA